jgi:precorrin-6B methylase 2
MSLRRLAVGLSLGLLLTFPASSSTGGEGIGKQHMGREIARILPAKDAAQLERQGRARRERPDRLLGELKLEPTMVVADIGAGTGFITRRLAAALPQGKVYAVEVQAPLVAALAELSRQAGMENIVPVLGLADDIRLPCQSLDLALMVDTYHEFEFPDEVIRSTLKALKPSGRLVVVEYRAEAEASGIDALHKMSEVQLRKELAHHALVLERVSHRLPRQHLLVYRQAHPPQDATARCHLNQGAPSRHE